MSDTSYTEQFQYELLRKLSSELLTHKDIVEYVGEAMSTLDNRYTELAATVALHYSDAVEDMLKLYNQQIDELIEMVKTLQVQGGASNNLQAMLLKEIAKGGDEYARYYNEHLLPKAQALRNKNGLLEDPRLLLAQAASIHQIHGRISWMNDLIGLTLRHGNDPGVICAFILYQLKTGDLDASTLESLPDGWIQDNIPYAPAKLSTLYEGLNLAYEFSGSGQRQNAFCREKAIKARNLRDYIKWLQAIRQKSGLKADSFAE